MYLNCEIIMESKLKLFGIIIFVFMINSYYTFATWRDPPVQYSRQIKKDCSEWLTTYRFSETDTHYNRSEAQNRNRKYDTDVVDVVAFYAQLICSFHSNEQFLPSDFCNKYDYSRRGFQKITVLTRRCTDWLSRHYGFVDERRRDDNDQSTGTKKNKKWSLWPVSTSNNFNYIEPETLHWHRSKNRNKLEDNYINIWAALFVRFLDDVPEEKSIKVAAFCKGMGQENNIFEFKFMTIETEMSCENWIEFAGYSWDMQKNLEVFNQSMPFDKYTNTWAKLYGDHLHVDSNGAQMPQGRTRTLDVYQHSLHVHLNPHWLTPYDFCLHEEGDDLYPRPLYNYHHSGQT